MEDEAHQGVLETCGQLTQVRRVCLVALTVQAPMSLQK